MTRRLCHQEKCAGLACFCYFSEEPLSIRHFMHNGEGERKIDFALQIGERHRLRPSHTRSDSAINPRFGQAASSTSRSSLAVRQLRHVTGWSNEARQF
jgi:hypothetical protein